MLARLVGLLRPPPAVTPIRDPEEVRRLYRYWRLRILYASLIGYALFYIVRKNLSVAMPMMQRDLGISKADLGGFLTLHGLCYGLSKFLNGILGDRVNPRYFMALGLAASAAMNVGFGLSSGVWALGLFWVLNGWFQGIGFPPCARSLTHWFAPQERGTKFALWNTSHSIGASLVVLLCSFLVIIHWRACFFGPAAIATLGVLFIVNRLRDTPGSLGLPPIEQWARSGEGGVVEAPSDEGPSFRSFIIHQVFLNPMIWVVSLANFCVYTVRYAVLDWGPMLLTETKGIQLQHAGWTVAAYEASGILGMLASGWITDRVFRGRAGRTCCLSMLMCGACIFLFWKLPGQSSLSSAVLLGAVGFFIYGPQCLVGVIAANLATKRAAATAIGLTGLFGYLSGVLSGWGLGRIVQQSGWNPAFVILTVSAGAATVLFAVAWNAAGELQAAEASPSLERADS